MTKVKTRIQRITDFALTLKYKAYHLNNFSELPQLKQLGRDQIRPIDVVGNILPFKTNNYVVEHLIDWSNIPADPIFRLTFPQMDMLSKERYRRAERILELPRGSPAREKLIAMIRSELNPHPGGQIHNVPRLNGIRLNGIQHKYKETVLFFPSQGQTCHAYCTFCFRWPQFTGINQMKFMSREINLLSQYLTKHTEITDLLFTGGDPLIMKSRMLSEYIIPLLKPGLNNIQTIRLGTKALGYWPYRFTTDEDSADLLRLFERIVKGGVNLSVMAHFNHPVELSTPMVRKAIRAILNTGAQIRTQSPILQHINDAPHIWSTMWRMQVNLNCIPYYMFVARDTGAQEYFSVPLVKAWDIFRGAYQKVSGICRTVRGPSMSCLPGKVQVLGVSRIGNEKVIVLRMLQGRNPEWVARPFFAKFNDKAAWLDELEPAFGKKSFFFEKELREYFHMDLQKNTGDDLE